MPMIGNLGENGMLNHALRYAKLGLSVIPLKPNIKIPLIPWTEFQSRRATEAEIRKWWNAVPNANIGIVTGLISGIAVIDLDGPKGLESASSLGLTSTSISLTGNGKHLWYRSPNSLVANSVRSFPGIDVRGEGGYICAPPSVHETGRRYRFMNSGVLPQLNTLPPFPTNIFSLQKMESTATKPDGWIAKALQEMKNGNIDETLFTVCSRLRSDGYSKEDAIVLLAPHAQRVGATTGHLEAKVENVWERYEPRQKIPSQLGWREDLDRFGHESSLTIHTPTNPDSLKQYEQRNVGTDNGSSVLQSGYPKLDRMLQDGLKSSRLFTVAARTGVGKTNWLISVARTICRTGGSVLLFSTEMPYAQIWERYIQTLENADEFKRHKLYVCDSFAPNLERVEEALNEIRPDVFMFDHINHVSEEQRELGMFMQGLNFLRRKYEIAGIVTAQLNRSADWVDLKTGEKVTPRMSMIKGSGTIEQASSRVLLLSETRVTPEGTEIVGNLDKNDNGPKGLLHFMLKSQPYKMVEL